MNPYTLYQKAIQSPWKWLIIVITIIYFISPIDAIPEILLPLVGYIDDGVLLSILIRELVFARKKKKYFDQDTLDHKKK
jgi:uncharacterized membrane protein YkvA (DUF1232 family)